jgi:diguanylate cyclase (GGDEF)-like protein
MEVPRTLDPYSPQDLLPRQPVLEQTASFFSSAQAELRAGLGWLFELGGNSSLPLHHQTNLVLINCATFASLLLALPGTLLLLLMGFSHPFSLLFSCVFTGCLVLAFNGVNRASWAELLFAYAPATLLVTFTLLELRIPGNLQPMAYLLARQGLCLALLLPILLYGFEQRGKVRLVLGSCVLIYLLFEASTTQLGTFQPMSLPGISHGLFTIFSMLQFLGMAGSVRYVQNLSLKQAQQAQQTQQKLHALAIHDGLTGIFNHAFCEQLIADAINRYRRSKSPLSLLMIDIDAFKQVNDTWGHNAGDAALKGLVELLNSHIRSTDYLGRWGGDELLLLLTDTDLPGAVNLAEKLRDLVAQSSFPFCQHLTISVGACTHRDGESPSSFIGRADAAMYRAKRGGRNRVEAQKAAVST